MTRKQPIPTDLDYVFGDNYLAQDIYIFFLLRARNDENKIEKEFAGTLHTIQRGQGVFGEKELANRFRCCRQTIRKTLDKLENVYNKVDIKSTTKGSLYTIVGYDDVVKMDNKTDNKQTTACTTDGQQRVQQADNSVDTNKSDKSVETDQKEKIDIFRKPQRKIISIPIIEKEELEEERGKSIVDGLLDRMENHCRSNNKTYSDYYATALLRLQRDGKKEKGKRKYEDKTHQERMNEFGTLSDNWGAPFKAKYGDDFGREIKEMYKKHMNAEFTKETFSK